MHPLHLENRVPMKQNLPARRPRGRGNIRGGRLPSHRNQPLESNGPEGRVRGTAQQILDRYLLMARDAQSSGDSVLAENLFQHAEHYQRIVASFAPAQPSQQPRAPLGEDQSHVGQNGPVAAPQPEAGSADAAVEDGAGAENGATRPRRRRRSRMVEAVPEGAAHEAAVSGQKDRDGESRKVGEEAVGLA